MFENIGKAVDKLNEWKKPEVAPNINLGTEKIVEILLDVPGMTVCNANHFDEAMPIFKLK